MASATVGVLRVLLTGNSAEFDAAMRKAADSAKVWSRDLTQIGRQAQDVGLALTKTLTLPIVGLAGASVKAASDFESSFAGIRKTVGDATDAMGNLTPVGERLAQGMRDLALTIPVNVNELNRIGEAAGQLGIKSENILGFTRVMADLGVTTNLSSDEAATALARLANITQMPQSEFDRLGATIVGLGNTFATTEAEIVEFGLRIAGAGQLAGLSEHQILAIGAAMSSVGVEAEAGGTSVQKVLNAMTESVATGGEKLEKFATTAGMSAQQFADAYEEDAAGAFNAFVQGLGTQGDAAFATLNGLGLSNERVIRAFLSLANAGDLLTDTLKVGSDSWQENTALTREAEQRYGTFENQLALFWARVRDVGIELGTALLPVLRDVLSASQPMISAASDMAKWFAALPDPIRLSAVGFAGLLAAVGPVTWAFGQAVSSIGVLIGAFTAKGIAMRALVPVYGAVTAAATSTWAAMLGPVVLVGGAIAAIGALGAKLREAAGVSEQTGLQLSRMNFVYGQSFDQMAVKANTGLPQVASAFQSMTTRAVAGLSDTAAALFETAGAITPLTAGMGAGAEASSVWGGELKTLATVTQQAAREQKAFSAEIDSLSDRTLPPYIALLQDVTTEIGETEFFGKSITRVFDEQARAVGVLTDKFQPFKAAVEQSRTDTEEATEATKDYQFSLDSLAGALSKLAQVSGDTFGGIVQQIATVVAAMNTGEKAGEAMFAGIAKMRSGDRMGGLGEVAMGGLAAASALGQATSQGSTLSRTVSGMATGAKIGMVFGPWGAAIGAAAGAVVGLVRGLTSVSEAVKQSRKEVDEFQKAIHASATSQQVSEAAGRSWALTVITVRDAFLAAGRSAEEAERLVAQMWNTDKPEAARQAMLAINKVLGDQRIEQELLQEAIQEYGFSIEELGPKFQAQRLSEQAQRLVEHYAVLIESGIEQSLVTERMAEKTNEYLATALRTNAEIPKSMEPLLAKMLEQGLLTDENGEKLTDLSRLTWAESMTQGFDRVVGAVERLIQALTGIPNQIGIDVVGTYIPPEIPGVGTVDAGFSAGTMGRLGKWLGDFGSGTPTVLHGKEMVVPQAQIPALFADMLAAATPNLPSLTAGPVVNVPAFDAPMASSSLLAGAREAAGGIDLSSLLSELRGLRRLMADLPSEIKMGYKAALAGA